MSSKKGMNFAMYKKKTFYCGKVIEVEKVCSMKYKGKSTARGPKTQRTPEAKRKQNEKNASKNFTRLVNTNFDQNSCHCTFTFSDSNRPSDPAEVKKIMDTLIRSLRKQSKAAGHELKYVYVVENRTRAHIHMIVDAGLTPAQIADSWEHGFVNIRPLDRSGDYSNLAQYLLKETNSTYCNDAKRIYKTRWCASKNLKKPIVKIEKVKADSWRETPVAPKGYIVLSDTIHSGVSEFTGWPYQYYKCLATGGAICKTKGRN